MTENFQAIIFEWKESFTDLTWTDISADVLHDPIPKGNIGIMDNGLLDRVADPGKLTFSLNNSSSNAAGTEGYYSPLGGRPITAGQLVRVGFTYQNRTRYKWFGYVEPGGVVITPGQNGPWRVDVTCRDWFGLIADHPLDLLARQASKRIDQAVTSIIATLPSAIQPAYTDYDTGIFTFATVFDLMKGETTALGEFNKLALSEMGYIYERCGNEREDFTLVVEKKTRRTAAATTLIPKANADTTDKLLLANGTDHLLLANGVDRLLLVETQTITFNDADFLDNATMKANLGRHYTNYAKVSILPRRVDAAATTVLWTMESSTLIAAGTTLTGIRGRYRDPSGGSSYVNGVEMVTPVASTDFFAYQNADGTGTNYTANCSVTASFGTAEVEISIQNTGGSDFYVGGDITFQVRGKGIYTYDSTDLVIESVIPATRGRQLITFDLPYQSDAVVAKGLLQDIPATIFGGGVYVDISKYPLEANRNTKNMMAFMYLEVGSLATFQEDLTDYNELSFINGIEFEIIDMSIVNWSCVLYREQDSVTA